MGQAEVKSMKEKREGIGHLQLFKNPSGKGQGGSIKKQTQTSWPWNDLDSGRFGRSGERLQKKALQDK